MQSVASPLTHTESGPYVGVAGAAGGRRFAYSGFGSFSLGGRVLAQTSADRSMLARRIETLAQTVHPGYT